MRGFVYALAAIAAVGIMIAIATMPSDSSREEAAAPAAEAPSAVETPAAKMVSADSEKLTLAVPEMHCEFACYPKVKETLEGTEGVELVELAPQKEAGAIDNRQVILTYKPGFDVNAAIAKLDEAGFGDSAVAE